MASCSCSQLSCFLASIDPGGGGSHMKGAGMLFGLTLGVLGQIPLYLAVKISFRVAREEI